MSAVWQKNEPTAIARRCDVLVNLSDGVTPADRSLDLMALGLVYFCGANSPHYDVALGTMTNKRMPLVVDDFAVTATDTVNDRVTFPAHGLETGDGPIFPASTGGNLTAGVGYYVIKFSDDEFSVADTPALAYAGTKRDITADVTGMVFGDSAATKRGIDGAFTYEATQPETDHGARESTVFVIGTLPGDSAATRAYTTVAMAADADAWGSELEDGYTRDDALRVCFRTLAAAFTVIGTLIQFRNIANTKDSHHGTITASGRSATGIDDPT